MNSVKNNVTLEGSNELLKKVIRFLTRNGNVELDYNAIIPMPEELKQAEAREYSTDDLLWGRYLTDGSIRPEAVRRATEWLTAKTGKRPEGSTPNILKKCKEAMEQDPEGKEYCGMCKTWWHNKQKYGYGDWMTWAKQNWGTGWGCQGSTTLKEKGVAKGQYRFTFWSAERTPCILMQKLKETFPMLKIEVDYADQKKGENTGWYRFEEEGTPPKVKVYKEYSKEACIHACKVWGEKYLISHIKSARETSPNPTYKIKDIYYIDYDEAIAKGDY